MTTTATSTIKPTHKAVQGYYTALQAYGSLNVSHEASVYAVFQNLLASINVEGY